MNATTNKIQDEIDGRGAIPFARFMELALYCPDCGFYENENNTVGRHGHFQTSVSAGSLFGELLAYQFVEWVRKHATSHKFQIIEAGAHDGRLCADVLNWFKHRRPKLFDQVEYIIIEPSARRRGWQRNNLSEHYQGVRWVDSFEDSSLQTSDAELYRIIFANELLDAMPAHRFGWDAKAKKWFEWGVEHKEGRFVWTRLNTPSTGDLPRVSDELLNVLPDNFTTEKCSTARQWWRNAAGVLQRGKLLTFDYGLADEEFFLPQRAEGTLRGYHRHQYADDPLANPGEQDLTAHVNFSAIQAEGEEAGLRTEQFVTQSQFLTGLAAQIWQKPESFGGWSEQNTRAFQTLTHPDHFGRAFKVLVQSR